MKPRIDTLLVFPTIRENLNAAHAALLAAYHAKALTWDTLLVLDGYAPYGTAAATLRTAVDCVNGAPIFNFATERRGLVGAFNVGFREFLSDKPYRYMLWLEDGITVVPGWDTTMRRVLENHPKFGWVACGQVENTRAPFTSMCSMMTLEAATAVGGLDDTFAPAHFDDADLFLRMMQAGFTPQAVDVKVSHPKARTSVTDLDADRVVSREHHALFQQRWGIRDWDWSQVPVHRCHLCEVNVAGQY